MAVLDLTPFGFTPTESRVYGVLLTSGPGTGYAIARSAGLARANAYSALEGLVTKGAAKADEGHPKRFRPEPPMTLLARISNTQGLAFERLGRAIHELGAPDSQTVVEIESPRGALQLLSHDIARAVRSVRLLAPAEAYPLLGPVLRRVFAAGLDIRLYSQVVVTLPFTRVEAIPDGHQWPGLPLISIVDKGSAIIASREGNDVRGHWSSAASFVAAAQIAFDRLRADR